MAYETDFINTDDPNLNVFATTASNATTSSFACYFDKVRLFTETKVKIQGVFFTGTLLKS